MSQSKEPWKPYSLDQLGFVGRGRSRHRPRNDPSLYGGPYPFFQTGDIKAAEMYLHEYSQTYNDTGLAQSRQWDPGTLCITIAANIAETAILTIPGCFPDSVVGFVADEDKADVRFIKYSFVLLKRRMQNVSGGTTQDNLSLDKLLTFTFLAPCVDIQRKIAAILSAYDDLIENNLRRITVLQEMARLIYREWFVHFRFPGHQSVRMVDSSRGPIPERWEATTLGEVLAELESGSRPRGGAESGAGGIPSIGAENILGLGKYDYQKEKYITPDFFTNMRRGHVRHGDVLLYKDGAHIGRKSLFRDGFPHAECAINEHVFILRCNDRCTQSYLYLWLDQPEMIQNIRNLNANAAQPGINQSGVTSLPILIPERSTLEAFEGLVEPLLALLFGRAKGNRALSRTRDLLLPKMISGELDVTDLDIDIGGLAS